MSDVIKQVLDYFTQHNLVTHTYGAVFLALAIACIISNWGTLATNSGVWAAAGGMAATGITLITVAHAKDSIS